MVNWKFSAQLHKLPACPECNAAALTPCLSSHGTPMEPHRIRTRVASGDAIVIDTAAARSAKKLRAIRELAATIQRPTAAKLERNIAELRRAWGIK